MDLQAGLCPSQKTYNVKYHNCGEYRSSTRYHNNPALHRTNLRLWNFLDVLDRMIFCEGSWPIYGVLFVFAVRKPRGRCPMLCAFANLRISRGMHRIADVQDRDQILALDFNSMKLFKQCEGFALLSSRKCVRFPGSYKSRVEVNGPETKDRRPGKKIILWFNTSSVSVFLVQLQRRNSVQVSIDAQNPEV
jgi:hypothetical protein